MQVNKSFKEQLNESIDSALTPYGQVHVKLNNHEFQLFELAARVKKLEKLAELNCEPTEPPKEKLSIGEAIFWLKKGYHVTRACWHNPNVYLWLKERSTTQGAEIRVFTIRGIDCIWSPNHDELLADDWKVCE